MIVSQTEVYAIKKCTQFKLDGRLKRHDVAVLSDISLEFYMSIATMSYPTVHLPAPSRAVMQPHDMHGYD